MLGVTNKFKESIATTETGNKVVEALNADRAEVQRLGYVDGIAYNRRELEQSKADINDLKNKLADALRVKPLAFSESDNTPCTAALEVNLEKLAKYFERRAKENTRRAVKEEGISAKFEPRAHLHGRHENSGFYFSGKADTYQRAANKVRELLSNAYRGMDFSKIVMDEAPTMFGSLIRTTATRAIPKPEVWIVETNYATGWEKSSNPGANGEFTSEAAALAGISKQIDGLERRARRIDVPAKPERWITEYRSLRSKSEFDWQRSGDLDVAGEFTSEAAALKAIAHNKGSGYRSIERRARRVE
jgi:hypothetical protein